MYKTITSKELKLNLDLARKQIQELELKKLEIENQIQFIKKLQVKIEKEISNRLF